MNNKLSNKIFALALLTAFLLLIPLLAMQFSDEVVWTFSDFLIAGILLFGTGLSYILATRKTDNFMYRIAVGLALASALFLIWANLAVGIIGSENNEINLLYFGVIAIGIIGALLSRFQAEGMTLTLIAMAISQGTVAAIALITGMAGLPGSSVMEIISVNGFFIVLFSIAAGLFRSAARKRNSIA